ncbi:hypothetical protein MMC16_006167 [Acarospora aff. strigata]|nr:hypothetical protein [Acarospora aff. strigata]
MAVAPERLKSYLDNAEDSRLSWQLAGRSSLPVSSPDEAHTPKPLAISNAGTSMLLSNTDRTESGTNPSHQLPALCRKSSTLSETDSIETPVTGEIVISGSLFLDEGPDGVLEIPAPSNLECPFDFLPCVDTFAVFEHWLRHTLRHFGHETPPTKTKCCFCEAEFEDPNGRTCWRQLLEHLKVHHRQGHILEDAPTNVTLIDYLFTKQLITNAEYQLMKSGGYRTSGPVGQGFVENSGRDRDHNMRFAAYTISSSARRDRRRQR